jgi:HAD superfamily phosphoserine phosphatase-like hydrolase
MTSQNLLSGFHYQNADRVSKKLSDFAAAGPTQLHIVSDFDLTLTAGKNPGQNIGTWDVVDELLPPEGVERHTAIYNSFRPIEVHGKLTSEMAKEKWSETLDLITSYHINIDDLEAAFLSVAKLRPGAKELFDICSNEGIPTVVLSSGIKNVVRIMAEHYMINPTHILSNDLEFDSTTHFVTGWRSDSLIHMLNKSEMGHAELSTLRKSRPNVLLLGDVPDDAKMVTGDNVIRIRILDPRKGEKSDLEATKQISYDAGYDLLVQHSLLQVSRITKWLTNFRPVIKATSDQ